jgi:CheY-like chemotaxis protein
MSEPATTPRVLVVEDEYLIRELLEDMVADLGFEVVAAVGTMPEANELAAKGGFQAAILDVNLDGEEIYPVAEVLAGHGIPFVFVTGYGTRSLPEAYRDRPALQKPFRAAELKTVLTGMLAKI